MVTDRQLLDIGNRFLKANQRADKLRKEFEKLLLERRGLNEMPSMTEKELGQIIDELKKAAEQEQ